MLLGDILKTFSNEAVATEYLVSLGNMPLVLRLRELANAEGESLGEFTSAAVQRYASEASEEEWLTLLGLLSRAADPAEVCLRRALEYTAEKG
ncbi:MAG: hypothetical protein KF826_09830 [Xanthobacteraceae bacterium]|nr:hypothetical protein [Xanthobacteraceae bacterium]MBX3522011.1 hypothetical protein [Xanthobacteraceae bacterium]MBX3534639.1 hypothetical protein [Xanthobacteraceae bacterium]MBX3549929.1 hypothetical protein [Xanthobacteraceae bacterium]MCW5675606.1 hypothetical protein [Xanthobacteraceae bacterium]